MSHPTNRRVWRGINHAQVVTTGLQTATLDDAAGAPFEGAIMFATFSINDFTFRSTEEYDPVDYWTLVGAAGGILGEMCMCTCVIENVF